MLGGLEEDENLSAQEHLATCDRCREDPRRLGPCGQCSRSCRRKRSWTDCPRTLTWCCSARFERSEPRRGRTAAGPWSRHRGCRGTARCPGGASAARSRSGSSATLWPRPDRLRRRLCRNSRGHRSAPRSTPSLKCHRDEPTAGGGGDHDGIDVRRFDECGAVKCCALQRPCRETSQLPANTCVPSMVEHPDQSRTVHRPGYPSPPRLPSPTRAAGTTSTSGAHACRGERAGGLRPQHC